MIEVDKFRATSLARVSFSYLKGEDFILKKSNFKTFNKRKIASIYFFKVFLLCKMVQRKNKELTQKYALATQ